MNSVVHLDSHPEIHVQMKWNKSEGNSLRPPIEIDPHFGYSIVSYQWADNDWKSTLETNSIPFKFNNHQLPTLTEMKSTILLTEESFRSILQHWYFNPSEMIVVISIRNDFQLIQARRRMLDGHGRKQWMFFGNNWRHHCDLACVCSFAAFDT